MTENRVLLLAVALTIAALILSACSQWHAATAVLWVLTVVYCRWFAYATRRR